MQLKNASMKDFSKPATVLFWFLSVMSFFMIFFDVAKFFDDLTALQAYIYLDFIHKVWLSLSTGWITVACHFGRSKFANKFLSNDIFKAIAKLSMAIYLIHLVVQFSMIYTKSQNYTEFRISELVSKINQLHVHYVDVSQL